MLHDDLIYALDPVEFSRAIGIDPDPWQAQVLRSENKRLLLNCCRQSGKSTTTATKALHTSLYKPQSLILIASPSLRQSQELFRKIKQSFDRLDQRPRLLEDNKLSMTLENGSRIVSLPGDQSTVRGYSGVTMILEDEAAQVSDAFYQAILPMLIVNQGTMICMSTPFGKRGHFFNEWQNGGSDWQRIQVEATQCPRMTVEELERQKRAMGDMFFRQEFMCEFVDNILQTFSHDSIERAFTDEIEPLEV